MLTKPQYIALEKWRSGKPANETLLKVREDVYRRLSDARLVSTRSFLMRAITEAGIAALAEYERKTNKS